MNIESLNFSNIKSLSFGAKKQNIVAPIKVLATDIVELTPQKIGKFPIKMEFSDLEKAFNEILVKYNLVERNARTQKQLLRSFYSAQDKYDYQELLKEKRNLFSKLKRLAKNNDVDVYKLENIIVEKKQYNRYAPKVFSAKTLEELEKVKAIIIDADLWKSPENWLLELIGKRKEMII